jgi:hypothetical protein
MIFSGIIQPSAGAMAAGLRRATAERIFYINIGLKRK